MNCELCKSKTWKYKCPRCEIVYCSLSCYKSVEHSDCSENFYEEWVRFASEGSLPTEEDKNNLMKKIVNSSNDDNDVDSEDHGDIESRMFDLDLDKDTDEIWNRLTKEERNEFTRLVESNEIANIIPKWKPWWKSKVIEIPLDYSLFETCLKLIPPTVSSSVVNDICSLCFCYCFLTRYMNGEIYCTYFTNRILLLCPFLNATKHQPQKSASLAVFHSVERIISNQDELTEMLDRQYCQKLICDVISILTVPHKIGIMKVLEDLHNIFTNNCNDYSIKNKKSVKLAKFKIKFLCGWSFRQKEELVDSATRDLQSIGNTWASDSEEFEKLKQNIEIIGTSNLKSDLNIELSQIDGGKNVKKIEVISNS